MKYSEDQLVMQLCKICFSYYLNFITERTLLDFSNHGQDLWINDIGKDLEGRFTCLSKNKYGSTSASAFVTVLGSIFSYIFQQTV